MLLSPERAGRPRDVDGPGGGGGAAVECPFCPGNEGRTAAETAAVREAGRWRVRAFANRYPAVGADLGLHEIVVNSPRHVERLDLLEPGEAAAAVAIWAERLAAAARDPRDLWPFLFLNQGAPAGASIAHTHAQVVGLPVAPPRVAARERAAAAASCIVCGEIAGAGERIVLERHGLVAWCPEVQPLAGAVRIAPAAHTPGWDAALDPDGLGAVIVALAGRARAAFATDALNLWLHQRRPGGSARHHWHVDLVPRTAVIGGCELGTGLVAVAGSPREDAARLRRRDQPGAVSRTTPATR